MLMRCSVAARQLHRVVFLASGASGSPESIWKPVVHPESIWTALAAPLPRGMPLAPPYTAAIQFFGRHGHDAGPSSERLEIFSSHPIAAPIWSNRRNRGTGLASANAEERQSVADGHHLEAYF